MSNNKLMTAKSIGTLAEEHHECLSNYTKKIKDVVNSGDFHGTLSLIDYSLNSDHKVHLAQLDDCDPETYDGKFGEGAEACLHSLSAFYTKKKKIVMLLREAFISLEDDLQQIENLLHDMHPLFEGDETALVDMVEEK